MEYTYVLISNGIAYLYAVVTDSNDDGRYHIYNFVKNNVAIERFNSIIEVESKFDKLKNSKLIEAWYPVKYGELL